MVCYGIVWSGQLIRRINFTGWHVDVLFEGLTVWWTLQIGSCTRLSVLSLRENWLSRLPSEIGNCKSLHVLDVSGNR